MRTRGVALTVRGEHARRQNGAVRVAVCVFLVLVAIAFEIVLCVALGVFLLWMFVKMVGR